MKKVKKLLSILLVAVMLICIAPIADLGIKASAATCVDLYPDSTYGYNCVAYARSQVPSLPSGITYYNEKLAIINTYTPVVGAVAIIPSSNSPSYGHVAVVFGINGSQITVRDGNYHPGYITERTGTASELKIQGYWAPSQSGHNPTPNLESCTGGEGTISISGWVFDADDYNASIEIHVYIGGDDGHSGIIANKYRPDVNAAYGCGDYHGFSETITTNKRETQSVAIAAINVGEGDTVWFWTGEVYISEPDTEAPIITNTTTVSDSNGYTITCNVSDNVGVTRVRFPTWTDYNGQDDLIWHEGTISGNTASCYISKAEHNNETGLSITNIYAYDAAGNEKTGGAAVYIPEPDTEAPIITNTTTVSDYYGYTITCNVSDNVGVTRVRFPTWTDYNGQDDLIWHEGTISGNTASCYISKSEHNNETGLYITHIYAYDAAGNEKTGGAVVDVKPYYYLTFDVNHDNIRQNLYKPTRVSKTLNGVNYSYDSETNTMFLNGTLTDSVAIDRFAFSPAADSVYKITTNVVSGSISGGYFVIEVQTSSGNALSKRIYLDTDKDNSAIWKFDSESAAEADNIYTWLYTDPGTTAAFDNAVIKVKIEKLNLENDSASEFSPCMKGMHVDETYGTLMTPVREGYDFLGWYTEPTGGTKITSDSTYPASDQTLYAHWSRFAVKEGSTAVIDGSYIYGLKTKLTAANIKNIFLDYEGVEVTLTKAIEDARYYGTGSTVTVKYSDGTEEVYTIIIFGDIDGNAIIDSDDAFSVLEASYDNSLFNAAQKKAANVDGVRRISIDDYSIINDAALGISEIDQTAV